MILVAITTCKREPNIVERALKSVIAQTYTGWDLVVVDDSPADWKLRGDVKNMIESYAANDKRIRYVAHDRNYGAQRARNNALKIADDEGFEFVAYLDDDEWLPEKLEKQIAVFNEHDKNTALVYCKSYSVNYDGKILGNNGASLGLFEGKVYEELILFDFVGTCSIPLLRTECLKAIGGFDENMRARQDWDTWLRLSQRYDIAYSDALLVKYYQNRKADEHISGDYALQAESFLTIMKKNADYVMTHKYAQWKFMKSLIKFYMESWQYKKGFSSWLRALQLQPQKTAASTGQLFFSLAKSYSSKAARFCSIQ